MRSGSAACGLAVAAALLGAIAPLGQRAAGEPAGPSRAATALLAVREADPLELARVTAGFSDDAVLALFAPEQPVAVRLTAVRASPWLREPERALARLCELLAGRDSELAPAAARSALQIAHALDADSLARREVAPASLTDALAALQGAAARPQVRQDIQRMAAAAAAQLLAASVPAPPAE